MSEALLKKVQEMLNEEKWTRATLSNYSIGNFKELDALIAEAREKRAVDDLKKICEEHLSHTKTSIIALYVAGIISVSRQIIDDTDMVNLITIFVDNHKWPIVKYLSERMLEYGESKYALRMLIECYKNENNEDALYPVYERLVKVDYEEADLAKVLAEYYEKQGKLEQAIDFYKKALHRYIHKKLMTNVKEIWSKLLELCPEDIDFFFHVQKKIAKNISEDKASLFLQDLYQIYKKQKKYDVAIDILKTILSYDERDSLARKEIVECYRAKYAGHSQLEEYIKLSNLSQSWRNVHEAIADFEKHIAFDTGNFVYHRTWGVGRIASVVGDEITIDFAKKRGHTMSLKMAVSALQILSRDHIWVLKATQKKEKLHDKVKTDPEWALKIIIRSFGNSCDMKRIKAELVPGVLSESEWTGWSNRAKEILKASPAFGVNPDKVDEYMVRDRPISVEEKIFNEFKATKNFFDRIQILKNFVELRDIEPDSEYFNEMFNYFTGYLKSYTTVNEQVIGAYLLIKDLVSRFPYLNTGFSFNFVELFDQIEDVPSIFINLKEGKLKEEFLKHIKLFVPQWSDIFIKLFPSALLSSMVVDLKNEGYEAKLVQMVQNVFENYREHKEAVLWIFKNLTSELWFSKTGISREKQIITLIHILDLSFREIENHRDTTENRRINKMVSTILFREGIIENFIENSDRDTITRIYTLVEDVKDLDPAIKMRLRNLIQKRYPDFKFYGVEEKIFTPRGLIVTAAKYQEKQRQLQHIMEVEVPANSKEIAFALSLGDLRENAEYKAAKEKQEILNSTVAKLKEEIERAQIFDPSTVNTSRVSFGTIVVLTNETKGTEETYTILGPWESDPEHHVISYLSPFGSTLLNKKVGERFDFSIDNSKISYRVKSISAASLE